MAKLNQILLMIGVGALCAASAMAGEPTSSRSSESKTITVEALNPFTRIVHIPVGFDPSSLKLERVRTVRVATARKTTTDQRLCDEVARRNSGASMYCPYREIESSSPAFEAIYSYLGQPMASDEYASSRFTFSVYFRPDELSPEARQKLSGHRFTKAEAIALFKVSTDRAAVQNLVIDEAASNLCRVNLADGTWMQADLTCRDKIVGKTIASRSGYIAVTVDLANASRSRTAE